MTEDVVNLLDRMYTDRDSGVAHPLITLEAAHEIVRLRAELAFERDNAKTLAYWLMHPYVFVHERIIEQLDKDLAPYHGKATPAV